MDAEDKELARRLHSLWTNADNDDEVEAGLRADLTSIEAAVKLVRGAGVEQHPEVAEEIASLQKLWSQGLSLMLRHRER
jgi:hypothetical protein